MTRYLRGGLALLGIVLLAGAVRMLTSSFDHVEHRKLFVDCRTCHAGAAEQGKAMFPTQTDCANCHDGKVTAQVTWAEPVPDPGNLRFTHDAHRRVARTDAKDVTCDACHTPEASPWMTVERAVVPQCFQCHGIQGDHYDAPDESCSECHVPLAQATTIAESRISNWKPPASHADPAFAMDHGRLAAAGDRGIAASCATCHARDFCASCHVNAPEEKTIQALAPDPRSLALGRSPLTAPESHGRADFLAAHGRGLTPATATRCGVCHTAENCATCHIVGPPGGPFVPASGPGRGTGAELARTRPATHGKDFIDAHAAPANANPGSCAGCHVREQCLDCHRPNAAARTGYHPPDYLQRHPVAAYARETSCSDCHNTGQFCQQCHAQAGLRSSGTLGTRGTFHDAGTTFVVGHGQAARQSLESCVSCHTERDCLACHSATGGRRFNPHGPGFDAERMRKQNSQMCTACHGLAIPGG